MGRCREALVGDAVLLTSELVTNAFLHGRPPIELRLRRDRRARARRGRRRRAGRCPRKLRPTPDDEHGRGLLIVSLLADRWGTRPTPRGKSVWSLFALQRYEVERPVSGIG